MIEVKFKKREQPIPEFVEFHKALDKFKTSAAEALHLPQLVDMLAKVLKKK